MQNYVCQNLEHQKVYHDKLSLEETSDVFAIWSTGNAKKLDLLMTELSGMIRKEKLSKGIQYRENKDHIDRHAALG